MTETDRVSELEAELRAERDRRDGWQIVSAVVLCVSACLLILAGGMAWS